MAVETWDSREVAVLEEMVVVVVVVVVVYIHRVSGPRPGECI